MLHKSDSLESIKARHHVSTEVLLFSERSLPWSSQTRQPSVHNHEKWRLCLEEEGEDWDPRLICCFDSWAMAIHTTHRSTQTEYACRHTHAKISFFCCCFRISLKCYCCGGLCSGGKAFFTLSLVNICCSSWLTLFIFLRALRVCNRNWFTILANALPVSFVIIIANSAVFLLMQHFKLIWFWCQADLSLLE